MATSLAPPILNPFTPMAFLSPKHAYQETITQYVVVGGLSVLIWDILTHLHSDSILVTQYRISLPTIIYFLSRWSTLLYAISTAVFQSISPPGNPYLPDNYVIAAPIDDCVAMSKVTCAVYHVTVSSTALLFFLRVRAIFNKDIYITSIFFFLWVAVLGGSLTAVLSLSGVHIGNTKYCTFSNFKTYRSAANITLAVFDTCVFIAITWRLSSSQLSIMKNDDPLSKRRFDLFGRYLPAFSRGLLQDGQKYYMAAMIANLLVLVLGFAPGVPTSYRSVFLSPTIALTNIMACRVFRHTKLGRDNEDMRTVSAIMFQKSNSAPTFDRTRMQQGGSGLTNSSVTRSELDRSSITETEALSNDSRFLNMIVRVASGEGVLAKSVV